MRFPLTLWFLTTYHLHAIPNYHAVPILRHLPDPFLLPCFAQTSASPKLPWCFSEIAGCLGPSFSCANCAGCKSCCWAAILLSNTSLQPDQTVSHCGLIVVRRFLWIGCCRSVAVDRPLWVDCCWLVAVGRLLCWLLLCFVSSCLALGGQW